MIQRDDPRVQAALVELQGRIRARYPEARFAVFTGEDPDGVYLRATVDVEDTDEVMDVLIERLIALEVDEGLPLYVRAVRPLLRVAEQLAARTVQPGVAPLPPLLP